MLKADSALTRPRILMWAALTCLALPVLALGLVLTVLRPTWGDPITARVQASIQLVEPLHDGALAPLGGALVRHWPWLAGLLLGLALLGVVVLARREPRPWLRPTRPLPGHGLVWWSVWVVAAVALLGTLVALAFLPDAELWEDVPAVATSAALAGALLLCLWAARRLRLAWLARRPGPIDVLTVTSAEKNADADLPLDELTLRIRRELARVNLYTPSLVPGADAPQDFLGLVQTAADGTGMIARISRLLGVAWPSHAYRVHCQTLRPKKSRRTGKGTKAFGVSVQVQLVPYWLSTPTIHWASTPEAATRAAAYAAAQEILPWTRAGRRPPWADWVDEPMPAGLLERYETGKHMVASRRYDEAIGAFRDGLRLDPKNLELRLEMAHVYQKLALWMDALELYLHVEELADARLKDLPRIAVRRKPRCEKRAISTARVVARYRRIISLTWGERLAEQWARGLAVEQSAGDRLVASGDRALTRRDLEKAEARRRLAASVEIAGLARRVDHHASARPGNLLPPFASWLTGVPALPPSGVPGEAPLDLGPAARDARETAFRLAFHKMAADEARRLVRWARTSGRLPRGGAHLVTVQSCRLVSVWADYHWDEEQRIARDQLDREDVADDDLATRTLHAYIRALLDRGAALRQGMPRDVHRLMSLEKAERHALRSRWGTTQWLDHYNAACVLAAPLARKGHREGPLSREATENQRRLEQEYAHLAQRAVDELRRAMRRTTAGMLGNLAPWVCAEDPDLDRLRDLEAFALFAKRQFPGEQPGLRRPPDAHVYELAMRSVRTARHSADLFSHDWRKQAKHPPQSLAEVQELLRREAKSWRLLRLLALNHKHSPTRLELIQEMTAWAQLRRVPVPDWRHPSYQSLVDPDRPLRSCRDLVDAADCRFQSIFEHLADAATREASTSWLRGAAGILLSGERVTKAEWRDIAFHQALLWHQLARWLDDDRLTEHASEHARASDRWRGQQDRTAMRHLLPLPGDDAGGTAGGQRPPQQRVGEHDADAPAASPPLPAGEPRGSMSGGGSTPRRWSAG